jgi:hypothetical protein
MQSGDDTREGHRPEVRASCRSDNPHSDSGASALPYRASVAVVRRVQLACVVVLLGSAFPCPTFAQPAEYSVKAAYLFNFINFTEWPPSAFADTAAPLGVCIAGPDPFGATLDEAFRGEAVLQHPLRVQRVAESDSFVACHVLFVPASVRDPTSVLKRIKNRPVLTVGESDAFWRAGGMIRLAIDGRTVRFDANARAAEAAGLRLSARLMQVARFTT